MIIWINGAFGSGKTTTAYELHRRLRNSFMYDPENAGFFIRRNTPKTFSQGDFQNIPLWREMNVKMLKMITEKYDGTVIVPMTLVHLNYYREIIGELVSNGIDVRHFILYASRREIKRRIKKRTVPVFGNDAFALNSIDRCVNAFDNAIPDVKIYTDKLNVGGVVEKIAELCSLQLLPDQKSKLGKILYRARVTAKHIR